MKSARITYVPHVELRFTRKDVELLAEAASASSMNCCRNAIATPQGFLSIIRNLSISTSEEFAHSVPMEDLYTLVMITSNTYGDAEKAKHLGALNKALRVCFNMLQNSSVPPVEFSDNLKEKTTV